MTIDSTNALSRLTTGTLGDITVAAQFEPVLQQMLTAVRRHCETPLLARFDSRGIVDAALTDTPDIVSRAMLGRLQDSLSVETVFDLLIQRALQDERKQKTSRNGAPEPRHLRSEEGADDSTGTRESESLDEDTHRRLALWLEKFYEVMQDVHPAAIEIVGLRVDGCQDREIAERLELGLRLVKRVVHDIRAVRKRTTQEE